jgi:hypothetical protein
MVEDGLINEHSIGFVTIKQKNMGGYNEITEVKLYEGSSLQGWGANEMTPITGMKNFETVSVMMDNIMKAIKNGKYTDETFAKLELQFLQLQKELADLKEASVESPEPSEDKSCVTVTIEIEDTEEHENPMEEEMPEMEEEAPEVEEEIVEEPEMEEDMINPEMEDEYEVLLNSLIQEYTNGKS